MQARGAIIVFALGSVACSHRVSLPPADAVAAMGALDRGITIEVEDGDRIRRFESYDDIVVELRRVCEERVITERPCNEGERFSENCIKHGAAEPKKRTTCRTPKTSFDKPFTWSYEDGDLAVIQRRERSLFEESELTRITIRENTPKRVLLVAGTALLVASAAAAGTYLAIDSTRGGDEDERWASDELVAVAVGLGLGAASLSITVPLTATDRVVDQAPESSEP